MNPFSPSKTDASRWAPRQTDVSSRLLVTIGLCLAVTVRLPAYDELLPPAKLILPAPRSPAESHEAITVAPHLQVELVAAEPSVMDPISVAWGADGRMWVVEMTDYPLGLDGRGKAGGRIKVLESTRNDGNYDKVTLFAEGLLFPTSVLPWRNGVLVTAAPHIMFLEDTDGDGRADKRENWFTGLGEGNHQHRANGLQWGLDGWLTISNGDSGGSLRSTKTGQVLEIGRRDLRIQAEAGLMESQHGRSQYGRSRDDWDNWFGGNNSNPIWHYALEERYLRRNSYFSPPNGSVPVPKVPGVAPVFPTSLTLARFNDGFGANRFTSACSTMIYRDDLLGPEYAGNIFVCEPVHNLVNRQILTPAGVSFSSERAATEQTAEFFSSSDNWSRFTNIRTGPDGALYMVDMYRIVIEHPQWIPAAWQKEKEMSDLRAGHDKGRIYRVSPKGRPLRSVPRLDRADEAGLVAALRSPNGVVRDLAQQQLVWRNARSAAPAIAKVAAEDPQAQVRVQALWTLELLNALTPEMLSRALHERHPGIRRHAVRLADRFAATNPELLPRILALADDPDAAVRQQVAYSLGEWRAPAAGEALARLAATPDQPLIVAAAMSSALPHADTMIARMNASGGANRMLIELILATQNYKALADVFTAIVSRDTGSAATRFSSLGEVLGGIRRSGGTLARLRTSGDTALQGAIDRTQLVFAAARTTAGDRAAPVADRLAAIGVLGQDVAEQEPDFRILRTLLTPEVPEPLQLAAVNALGQTNLPSLPTQVLAGWDEYSPAVRRAVIEVLTTRPTWIHPLLDRVATNREMREQISAGHRATLLNHGDGRVAARAAQLFTARSGPEREKVVEDYLAGMNGLRGSVDRGRTQFVNTCAACHQLGDAGGRAIGPDLAGLNDRSAAYLVPHILDPNRAIEDKYLLYTVATNDGRTLAGLLASEAGSSLTLVGLDGAEQVILRNAVKSVTPLRRSLMPEGLEASFSPQGMADLIAYIAEATAGTTGPEGGRRPTTAK